MGSLAGFLLIYILGGLTFIPLVLALIFLHAYLTLPTPVPDSSPTPATPLTTSQTDGKTENKPRANSLSPIHHPNDDEFSNVKSAIDVLAEKFQRAHEADVAAGYFAVCREYVPGGVNGKPPERTTPAGEVVAAPESLSVYQSMYRSIFDRKQGPTIDPGKGGNNKNVRKARNVFWVILRHGHLMLYDDQESIEVRHVISLAHHDVSIYGGEGDVIPEGELWLKRNAICLSRKQDSIADLSASPLPFYLFSENQSEKEDFYFAMLKNQEKNPDAPGCPPTPQHYEHKHIVRLIQQLHASEDHLQTRWINAMLGRLFLALYKTPEMEEMVRRKITKKISRVKKPNFITKIALRKIDLGEGAPLITNPKLKDLTVDGDCCLEMDVEYSGNARLEVSATARIDLGPRFKAREVDLVLAVVLKRLEGHGLVRLKPPPSNRLWISFETMPNVEMTIEPIVSSRQITYGVILRTIESRIREVLAETLVFPFWDDIPFLDTESQQFRGGIWQRDISTQSFGDIIPDDGEEATEAGVNMQYPENLEPLKGSDRTMSMPVLHETTNTASKPRKDAKAASPYSSGADVAASSGVSRDRPRAMRSETHTQAAHPVVTTDNVKVSSTAWDSTKNEKKDATSTMMEISSRSQPTSPTRTPVGSPKEEPRIPQRPLHSESFSRNDSKESVGEASRPRASSETPTSVPSTPASHDFGSRVSLASDDSTRSKLDSIARSFTSSSTSSTSEKRLSIGQATAAAKRWSWNVLGRNEPGRGGEPSGKPGGPDNPIGRGRPLPPPGTPLPPPERNAFRAIAIPMPKRKPVPSPNVPEPEESSNLRPVSQLSVPRRKSVPWSQSIENDEPQDEVLIVAAPEDSEPTSPAQFLHIASEDRDQTLQGDTDQPSLSNHERTYHVIEPNETIDNSSHDDEADEVQEKPGDVGDLGKDQPKPNPLEDEHQQALWLAAEGF